MDTSKTPKSESWWVRGVVACTLVAIGLTTGVLAASWELAAFYFTAAFFYLVVSWLEKRPRPAMSSTDADPPPTEIPPTYCRDCVSFDTKAGQEQLRKFPAFAKVAKVLTPDQLTHAGLPHDEAAKHDDGSGWPDAAPSEATAARLDGRPHTWDQYGLCARHLEIVNCYYTCDQYRRRVENT